MNKFAEIIAGLQNYDGPEIKLMEVCGTHTASIAANGIKSLISPKIKLISGPGCPVCVTPKGYLDEALELAENPRHVLVTFADMLRVPGSRGSLAESRAEGAQVEIMYSPQEALERAAANPDKIYIVLAVGFETTVPAYCLLLAKARERKITNIRLHYALRRIIPALEWIAGGEADISGYICPGHVSAIIGSQAYLPLARRYHKPYVVAGFSAEHILLTIYDLVKQIRTGGAEVRNLYPSVVAPEGNTQALAEISRYFTTGRARWRGLGIIEDSGYYLREEFRGYEARLDTWEPLLQRQEKKAEGEGQGFCRCSEVITGQISPAECPGFGKACTPMSPQGPCMVSGEGACGIWYRYNLVK